MAFFSIRRTAVRRSVASQRYGRLVPDCAFTVPTSELLITPSAVTFPTADFGLMIVAGGKDLSRARCIGR